MNAFRIVFIGTPSFSVPTLKILHDSRHELVAVVTNPDRPKGRGRRLEISPVKEAAVSMGYPVLQPDKAKNQTFLDAISRFKPDLFVVVAYGQILPPAALHIPRIGSINIHASLLPQYRGPAPIQWAVVNGDEETGITTMWMDDGMDTGDILLTQVVAIGSEDTSQSLHDHLAEVGAHMLLATIDQLDAGTLKQIPQDHSRATYAPLLRKNDGLLDWTRDAKALDCFVRGMYPWPGAFTFLHGKRLKVLKAQPLAKLTDEAPGTVLDGFPGDLDIATGAGILRLKEVHLESGKRLSIGDFLKGYQVPAGTCLGH